MEKIRDSAYVLRKGTMTYNEQGKEDGRIPFDMTIHVPPEMQRLLGALNSLNTTDLTEGNENGN